jgi:hypothetical protein
MPVAGIIRFPFLARRARVSPCGSIYGFLAFRLADLYELALLRVFVLDLSERNRDFGKRLGRLQLLGLFEFLGRFLGCHGFSPSRELHRTAFVQLYANPGPTVHTNETADYMPANVQDATAALTQRVRQGGKRLLNNSTSHEKFSTAVIFAAASPPCRGGVRRLCLP